MTTKNMAFVNVGRVLVAVHNEQQPLKDEWTKYLETLQKVPNISEVRTIAFTDGGAPDSNQRKLLNELLPNSSVRAAVVTSSALVRSVVTALSWFNKEVKCYAPDGAAEAYAHLQLTSLEIDGVKRQLQILTKTFPKPLRCVPG